jgi:hypothetical protein
MALLAYPLQLTGPLLAARGKARAAYTKARPAPAPTRLARDWRLVADTTGTVATNNRVMFRAQPSDPEAPFAGARVRLHRLADGYCAWQGASDAQGYYWADGLEVGVAYYPIAIDLLGQFEVVAAGPVVATRAEA